MTQSSSPKAIFLAAKDILDAGERTRYLREACAGDAALRARVEQLLQASTQADDFLADTAEVEKELHPALGDRIGYFGDYVLLDEIARGASGVVFRARQSSLDRVVALKMLRGHALAEGDDGLRRFKAEAQAAAGLKHPNLVPIYEVGEFEGQGYYSMPLIEGGTLISRAAEFHEPRNAVTLMVKVARAIHAAHERGLLHRDIKPGNILLNAEGEPQVTDFGIARKMGLDSDLTVTGQIMGTPYYMSPEQASGETQTLTAATDVYAIGAVLYELLTGEKPFAGERMIEVLKKVVEELPKAPQGIERDLSVIVMKCLEKAPISRYSSAAALADDLEHWLRGEPITARPAGRVERMVKWVRRSPYKAALFALAAVCLVSWAVFALLVSTDALVPPQVVRGLGPDYIQAKEGKRVDLMKLIHISPAEGNTFWTRSKTELFGSTSKMAVSMLPLPIISWYDYDLEMKFQIPKREVMVGGEGPVWLIQVGRRRVQFLIGARSSCACSLCLEGGNEEARELPTDQAHPYGPVTGLFMVKGKNPAFNASAVYRHTVESGIYHHIKFQVRVMGAEAKINIELDHKPLTSWTGPITDLTVANYISNNYMKSSFGIFASSYNESTFSEIYFTPVRGQAWRRKAGGQK
jgi:tRNA A-37 threonylcarbamoyl transferase component Bud32